MVLRVYNTRTNSKEELRPIDDQRIKMYVCGVTVYDDIHMGHARNIVVFDMVARYLRYRGYEVLHATNFTDVDDKIITRANEMGIPPLELSARYIDRYFEEIASLGVRKADIYPKASENIPEIIDMVQRIIDNGFGYVTEDGSVYFSVAKVENYGRLTNQRLEDMESGVRVDMDQSKRDPMDFAIWKAAKPGEIAWESPWGKGRPGWHIECSAMIQKYLGDVIDIHGGGNDLIFPHHENEILQTEAAVGTQLANYWMHNGMLQVKDAKMSKSLKNFFRVKDILAQYSKEEVRFYLLNTHYRGPLEYSEEALDEAAVALKRLHNTFSELNAVKGSMEGQNDAKDLVDNARREFIEAMDDDFNSRAAISGIFQLARETNRLMADRMLSDKGAASIISFLQEVDEVLGILPEPSSSGDIDEVMAILIDVRRELRSRKIFDLADGIRDRLKEAGIQLEDSGEGVRWKRI